MAGNKKTKADEKWLAAFGAKLAVAIKNAGYKSPYDFWIHKAGDVVSRSGLNMILNGRATPRITTMLALARILKTPLTDLINFED